MGIENIEDNQTLLTELRTLIIASRQKVAVTVNSIRLIIINTLVIIVDLFATRMIRIIGLHKHEKIKFI